MAGLNSFTIFDYIVVGASLLMPLVIGIYHIASSKQTGLSLFTGEKSLNILPVAISVMMTYMSTSTVIDYPTEVYHFGAEIIAIIIVMVVFIPLGACTFVPVLYDKNLTSIYEYLGNRFNSTTVKLLASVTFIIQQLVLTAITMFMSAIVVKEFIGLPIWLSILIVGICGTLYTSLGGLKTIVWVETFQLVVIICALVAVVSKGFLKAGGFSQVYEIAKNKHHEVLPYFKLTFSPFARHTFVNFLLWHGFYAFILPGCDQIQVQRYSSIPKRRTALHTVLLTVPLKVLLLLLCLLAGIVICASNTSDNVDVDKVDKVQWKDGKIISSFVFEELSYIPGMLGLFTASLLAFSLSLFASPVNSMSAVTWKELMNSIDFLSKMNATKQAMLSRYIEIFYGCLLIGLAIGTEHLHSIFDVWTLTFGTLSVTYSALAGTFILALFFPCSNKFGAVIGFLCGATAVTFLCVNAFLLNQENIFLNDDNFSKDTNSSLNQDHPAFFIKNNEWLEKLSLISYLLYPIIGTVVTLVIGLLISLLTGGLCQCFRKKVDPEYLHPFLRCQCDCCAKDVEFESLAVSQRYADRIASVHNIYTGSSSKLHTPPSYTYYQYSPVETRISRNLDTMYSELSTPPMTRRQSAEYVNI